MQHRGRHENERGDEDSATTERGLLCEALCVRTADVYVQCFLMQMNCLLFLDQNLLYSSRACLLVITMTICLRGIFTNIG